MTSTPVSGTPVSGTPVPRTRRTGALLATAALLMLLAPGAIGPAAAHDHDRRYDMRYEHWQPREPEYRHHRHHYHPPPPLPLHAMPPAVIYAPPPRVYYPTPAPVYPSPGLSVYIPLR
jgi:hypothetical protein